MTNKPMLSVERKVIEDILADAREPGTDYMAARKVLRALLDKPAAQHQPAPISLDIACDRAYRNGLQRGLGLGENGQIDQYHKEFDAYQREILKAGKEQLAPVAITKNCCGSCPGGCVIGLNGVKP